MVRLPGIAASRGTRAVTVWSEPSRTHHPGVFHLSVTEDGEERYAFTVRATSVSGRGSVPAALDLDRLFPRDDAHTERRGERRALEALAAEFGVRLPGSPSVADVSTASGPGPGTGRRAPARRYVTWGVVRT
ncbi:hypothetical protein O1M63_08150 [Streptomyces mirabilis]|nr:hypothetical protein [Streptomyces mirabilis]